MDEERRLRIAVGIVRGSYLMQAGGDKTKVTEHPTRLFKFCEWAAKLAEWNFLDIVEFEIVHRWFPVVLDE